MDLVGEPRFDRFYTMISLLGATENVTRFHRGRYLHNEVFGEDGICCLIRRKRFRFGETHHDDRPCRPLSRHGRP